MKKIVVAKKTALEVPKVPAPKARGRPPRVRQTEEVKSPAKDAKNDKEEIIGVKVVDTAQMPDPKMLNKNLAPMEEEKKAEA